jgi:hypothetical protein
MPSVPTLPSNPSEMPAWIALHARYIVELKEELKHGMLP